MDHLSEEEQLIYDDLKRQHPHWSEKEIIFHLKLSTGEINSDIIHYDLDTGRFDDEDDA